jgi:hypothetical protein
VLEVRQTFHGFRKQFPCFPNQGIDSALSFLTSPSELGSMMMEDVYSIGNNRFNVVMFDLAMNKLVEMRND